MLNLILPAEQQAVIMDALSKAGRREIGGVLMGEHIGPNEFIGHCCKVSDEAAFCLIQRPYISKTLLTRRISPRGSP